MSKGSFITRTPKTIPGLTLWLDAADASTITIATGVSSWLDKSGNGFNPTQATGGSQPAYTANLQGGLPGLVFDGVNDIMMTASNSTKMEPGTGFMSIFIVSKLTTSTSLYNYGKGRENATSSANGWANSDARLQAGTSAPATNMGSSSIITLPETNASIKEWYFTGTTLDYLKDGASFGTQKSYSASVDSASVLAIGGRPSLTLFASFSAFEFIIYNVGLSTGQRQQVRQYLGNKWGVTTS